MAVSGPSGKDGGLSKLILFDRSNADLYKLTVQVMTVESGYLSEWCDRLSLKTSLKKIIPGQIPVTAEIRKKVAGRYNNQ